MDEEDEAAEACSLLQAPFCLGFGFSSSSDSDFRFSSVDLHFPFRCRLGVLLLLFWDACRLYPPAFGLAQHSSA